MLKRFRKVSSQKLEDSGSYYSSFYYSLFPPYASKGVDWSETNEFIGEILSHFLLFSYSPLYPIFKIIPIFEL